MVWQKIDAHINGQAIRVESKDGNQYIAETKTKSLNKTLYEQLINRAHDSKTYWAWVEFEDDNAVIKEYAIGERPEKPPWGHP